MQHASMAPISLREKIAFFFLNLGNIPLMTLITSYLTVFYTDVVGLDPASVATLILVARIVDGINDPLISLLLDRLPRRRMGKFRPILLVGVILCVINYALVWFAPLWAENSKLVVAYVSYLLLGITFDLMDIPLNSMLPLLSANPDERRRLSHIKSIAYKLGGTLVSILASQILRNTFNLKGYYFLIFGTLFFVLLFSVVGVLGVRERNLPPVETPEDKSTDLGVFTEKPVRITALSSLIHSIGGQIAVTVNIYFYSYILGDLTKIGVLSSISLVTTTIGTLLSGKFLGQADKKKAVVLLRLLPIPFSLLRLVNIRSFPLIVLSSIASGFCSSVASPAHYGIQADNADYIYLHRGHRADAAIATLSSFTSKCAMGIGGALPGYFLALAGFQKSLPVQPSAVYTTIILCVTVIPALFQFVSALLFFFGYPLDKATLNAQNERLLQRTQEA